MWRFLQLRISLLVLLEIQHMLNFIYVKFTDNMQFSSRQAEVKLARIIKDLCVRVQGL